MRHPRTRPLFSEAGRLSHAERGEATAVTEWKGPVTRQHSKHPSGHRQLPRAARLRPGTRSIQAGKFSSHLQFLGLNVFRIEEILRASYGQPSLGNKADPVDELVYIMLSRRTREAATRQVFVRLKRRFPLWEQIIDATPKALENEIGRAGLAFTRAQAFLSNMRVIKREFGSMTLDPLRDWSDGRV